MTIKDFKLKDLYERYMNFINSYYIHSIINETTNTVSISYSGELARIFMKIDNSINCIVVKITQNPLKKMSDQNGKIYYLGTIDELTSLIAATKVIMDLKIDYESTDNASPVNMLKQALTGQGYLMDSEKKLIGVVDLTLIPTNAFIYESDKINNVSVNELKNNDLSTGNYERKKSILKFF